MSKKEILITGGSPSSLDKIAALITDASVIVAKPQTAEEAIEKFHQQEFSLVIFSDEIDRADEKKLRKLFGIQNPGLQVLQFHRGDDASFTGNVTAALSHADKKDSPMFSFVDDALKNAGLHITIQ